MPAVAAGHLAGDAVEVKRGSLRDGSIGDDVPIELNRVINYRRELTDHQVDVRDSFRVRFLGVAHGNIEDALGDG